jgi:hypothetical protein
VLFPALWQPHHFLRRLDSRQFQYSLLDFILVDFFDNPVITMSQ